mmetsp:Transcript_10801/g.27261  ORF Transcript_10801/g.27261 Transcript_10801/m.27261 type:complete len:116 (+) Transcript_10801:553-900(+)
MTYLFHQLVLHQTETAASSTPDWCRKVVYQLCTSLLHVSNIAKSDIENSRFLGFDSWCSRTQVMLHGQYHLLVSSIDKMSRPLSDYLAQPVGTGTDALALLRSISNEITVMRTMS